MTTVPRGTPLGELMAAHAATGRVGWIGRRTERRGSVEPVERVRIGIDGLVGDHRARPGKRAVTVMQAEHVAVIAALVADGSLVTPEALRRNIHVAGINVLALRDREFRIGSAVLRGTGLCAPCSRMTEAFGPGGYNAVRGHGGITAEVIRAGDCALGDEVEATG